VGPGRYYISVLHDNVEYIQEFWIYEPVPVDPAEGNDIFEGSIGGYIGGQ
jgi:hypothetical protein